MPARSRSPRTVLVRHSPMEHPRGQYPHETAALQRIAESCGLTETIKWGKPCYTLNGKNIVLIQRFNDYIALMFTQGALLKDPDHLLFRVGEHTRAARQLRFSSVAEITQQARSIKAYIEEAMQLERSGAKLPPRTAGEHPLPEELEARFEADQALAKAFAALTPGRQRGYIFQIAAAKQAATRASRVEKFAPRILAGKGLNDE